MDKEAFETRWLTAASWDTLYMAIEPHRRFARKMRLFGCACCRRLAGLLVDPRSREAVEVGERFADGEVGKDVLTAARKAANEVGRKPPPGQPWTAGHSWAASAAEMVAHVTYQDAFSTAASRAAEAVAQARLRTRKAEEALQVTLLRDIFGNPFRPVAFDPTWQTDTAVSLARTMYEEREFSAMPILADALQDAGCDSDDMLAHCRDPNGVHVRGCWVVDLVLGKS